jgi:type VI protein secretion system component VasK
LGVMDFSDFFWLLIWSFFFVCYLMVLFQIIGDLFRDRELSGWWKALWVIFLIIFPFLAAVIYLIARGRGMAERQAGEMRKAQVATDQYIQSVAGAGNPADQIASAKSLLDSGTITQEEFDKLKQKALAS